MPISFDWDFEEEEPDPSSQREGIVTSSGRQRRWLPLGVALFTLFVVGGLVARIWVNSRLNAVEKVEEKLRGIVELELKNIADGDVDLFRALQDPSVFRWQDRQVARYITDPTSSASELGEQTSGFSPAPGLRPADRLPKIRQVRVFGHTGRVELVRWFHPLQPVKTADSSTAGLSASLARWFQSLPSAESVSLTDPLPFQVTWFYRLDEDGTWYHTAPPNGYEGVPYSWYATWIDVHATAVGAEALSPVVGDLTVLVLHGCRLLGCVEGEHYTLSFDGTLSPQVHGRWWTLPALYLTGVPDDQQARDAWLLATKLWLAEALARSRASDRVTDRVVYRHLVTRLQVELELSEPLEPDVEALTQALNEGNKHSLQDLWEAKYDPDDPEGNRLLDAEAAALLQWLEDQVGVERLFELLPALHDHQQLDDFLLVNYHLSPPNFELAWFTHLLELTGMSLLSSDSQAPYQALESPSPPLRPPFLPGDQIAYACNGRLWVSNADGSRRAALTSPGLRFEGLNWSPDGRWLLTALRHGREGESALYMLAADGSSGRLLTDDPTLRVFPLGWSPDGQVTYAVQRDLSGGEIEFWATDIETGRTRELPGSPTWSPDGRRLAYVAGPADAQGGDLWVANVHWASAHRVVTPAQVGTRVAWSPDGSRLAVTLLDDDPTQNTIAIHNPATGSVVPLISAVELSWSVMSALREEGDGDFITHGTAPDAMLGLQPAGWSADGRHLIVWAYAAGGDLGVATTTALTVVPLDGSSPRLLAFGRGGLWFSAAWSPTDPDLLTFAWPTEPGMPAMSDAYLFDLNVGLIYTATRSWGGVWSPDGAWVAFPGQDAMTIVDQSGHALFALDNSHSCSGVVWNPAADLSALGRPIALALTSAGDEWTFDKVRLDHDQLAQALHVWGEVINQSGSARRILAFVPFIQDSDGNPINHDQRIAFPAELEELFQTVSLADGQGLPFNFTVPLPSNAQLEDSLEIVVRVASEPAEPTRDNLTLSIDEFDLSESLPTFYLSEAWENPGPDLTEYVAMVVTVYDHDQVLGWGWHKETNPTYLASGVHDLQVEFPLSETAADLEQAHSSLSYTVQFFAH